jgi:hypothetical protein
MSRKLWNFRQAMFDKGFNSYPCFYRCSQSNRYFWTRKKEKARFEIGADFDCFRALDIEKDKVILLKHKESGGYLTVEDRMVFNADPEKVGKLELITNLIGHDKMT